MGRLKQEDKEMILADFHTGHFNQRKLANKYKVSTATINKLTKGLKPKHIDKVNTTVAINKELSKESEQEVNAVNSVINERTKHEIYFLKSALKNQQLANSKIDSKSNLSELETHSRITSKNKDTVLGKEPKTVVNNTNAQQNVENKNIKIMIDE